MALGEFYDEVIETLDSLVETYQGYAGKIGPVEATTIEGDAKSWLPVEAKWIIENREDITRGEPMLQNILDTLSAHYSHTFYKIRDLS